MRIASISLLILALMLAAGSAAGRSIRSKDIHDNSIKSKDVKNSALQAVDLRDEAGFALAPSPNSSVSLAAADSTVRTTTLVAPVDGNVVFHFQGWFTCTSSGSCVARCSINPGGRTLDTARFAITSVASGQYQTMSIMGALPVVEDQALTLNAVCDTFAGTGSLGDPSLTAIFSPTVY